MSLSIKEVARMMNLPEITIIRWIKQGKIPFYLKDGRYVFNEKQLVSWAKMHNISLRQRGPTDKDDKDKEQKITLYKAINKGGVFFDVGGENVKEVLRESINLIELPSGIDKEELFEKLIQREELCSTGIGDGVAIPHPRHPIPNLGPMVPVFFLKKEIDFNAIDGKPVFVLFIILSPSTNIHLRLLSCLSFCLRDKDFLKFLKKCDSKDSLLNKIQELESITG